MPGPRAVRLCWITGSSGSELALAEVAALSLTIAEWNDDHGAGARRIAVMVPVNMRPSDWQQEVVGNVLLPVRVSTDASDRSSPMAALEAVVEQSRRIKESGGGGALIEVLGRSTSLGLGVKGASSPLLRRAGNRLACSALLSNLANLNDPPSFGDAGETTEVWFSAPARMPLGLSVGVVTVARSCMPSSGTGIHCSAERPPLASPTGMYKR